MSLTETTKEHYNNGKFNEILGIVKRKYPQLDNECIKLDVSVLKHIFKLTHLRAGGDDATFRRFWTNITLQSDEFEATSATLTQAVFLAYVRASFDSGITK